MTDREAAIRTQIELWYAEVNGPEALAEEPAGPFEAAAHYIVMNDNDIDVQYRDIAMIALDVLRLAYSSEFKIPVKLDRDEILEQLYNLDRTDLRRVAYEALLMSDGPDHIEGYAFSSAINVTRRDSPKQHPKAPDFTFTVWEKKA